MKLDYNYQIFKIGNKSVAIAQLKGDDVYGAAPTPSTIGRRATYANGVLTIGDYDLYGLALTQGAARQTHFTTNLLFME